MAGSSLFEPFETEVVKQLADGTGYVKAGRRYVQAGPVHCQNGTTVIAVLVGEDQALILSKFAVPGYYSDYLSELESQYEVPDRYLNVHKTDSDELDPLAFEGIIEGYRFEAEILEITDNQMGIVTGPLDNRIKMGPVTEGVGKEVQLEYIGNNHAYCHNASIQATHYSGRLYISAKKYSELPIQAGEIYTGRVFAVYDSNATVELTESNVHTHIKSSNLDEEDAVRVRITGFASQSAKGELMDSSVSDGENTIESGGKDSPTETRNHTPADSKQLKALRERAEKNSRQPNTDTTTTSTTSTNQYNRSNTVRQYAKKRANGKCEGCNSPAPFRDKENKPYLHVHHLDELSEGGDDSPDNVVCLCPNCHYRIHHGKDGSNYNERLKKKVNRIESNIRSSSDTVELEPGEKE